MRVHVLASAPAHYANAWVHARARYNCVSKSWISVTLGVAGRISVSNATKTIVPYRQQYASLPSALADFPRCNRGYC
jgi:hypothetical protein